MRRLGLLAFGAATAALLAPAPASASFAFKPAAEGFSVSVTAGKLSPTQAGNHPGSLQADLALQGTERLRDLAIHLPAGLLINPSGAAASECSDAAFHTHRSSSHEASLSGEDCPNSSQVGVIALTKGAETRHFGLFNLVSPFGDLAAIGASPWGTALLLEVREREADSGLDLVLGALPQSLDPKSLEVTLWGTPQEAAHDAQRGDCLKEEDGGSWNTCGALGGEGAGAAHEPESQLKSYLTMPSAPCGSPLPYSAEAASWQGASASAAATTPALGGCNTDLTIAKVALMTDAAAARTGLAFSLDVNDGGGIANPGGIARPAIAKAVLSLPEGLTINPSLAAGLGACSEAEFAAETALSEPGAGCPNASKIGDVTLEGTLGLAEPLKGSLYLATPKANPFGALFGVYLLARNPRRGLIVKSKGEISPDPNTGRLVATFEELPRLLYTHFGLTLREGNRSALLSPQACRPYTAELALSSWAAPQTLRHESSAFFIDRECPGASLPFAPGLLGGSMSASPATYTPFYLRMTRTDPEQEITAYAASFPPGLLAKIAGVAECPEAAIEAAKHRSGAQEEANPSCPSNSSIGHTISGYGVGGTLAWAPGGLYLAGPWHGQPLSVVAIDSAKIGPFDLGVVVVRTAVKIDTRTAEASIDPAGSDPIPHIIDGIPIHVRDIRIYIDRPEFTITPTSCDRLAVSSTLTGAGSNPFAPGDETQATSSQRYQLLGCRALGFKPGLTLRLRGGTKRSSHPSFRAEVRPRPHQANISAASVKLPPSLFLAQEHLHDICTRAQFNANGGGGASCPEGSVYGHARAWTPLLAEPLEGDVYIRSSDHPVPDLVVALKGHGLTVVLEGRIDSHKGGLRGSFEGLPDAPLSKFVMTLPGGRHGLLSVAEDLCKSPGRANSRWLAQDNDTAVLAPKLSVRCKKARRRKGRRR